MDVIDCFHLEIRFNCILIHGIKGIRLLVPKLLHLNWLKAMVKSGYFWHSHVIFDVLVDFKELCLSLCL